MRSGDYLEPNCACHIAPPCYTCENTVWIVVRNDDMMLDLEIDGDGHYTEDFDKAIKYATEAEAEEKCKEYDHVEPRHR